MANATIVYFKNVCDYDNTSRIFRIVFPKRDTLWVNSFEDGIVTVDPSAGSDIRDFAEIIAGCFKKDSNFEEEIFKAFDSDENATFRGIKFNFNGVTLVVTKENASKEKIYQEWNAGMEANAEKGRLEREAYMKTPEYRAKMAKALKAAIRKNTVEQEVLFIDETTEMDFKDDEASKKWEEFVKTNSKDSYSYGVVKYARRWAKYMQHLMSKHCKTVYEIAESSSQVCDIEKITIFMYGCAVNILAECWKYGEELRIWHNGGYVGNGVINPAVLTIDIG